MLSRSVSLFLTVAAICALGSNLCRAEVAEMIDSTPPAHSKTSEGAKPKSKAATATFGTGCFWCTEAIFEQLDGVIDVVSGYIGGHVKNPTYEQVCSGMTGHAEAVEITYDPSVISYEILLQVFWKTHDPTTLNRQGNDVGTQYRSAIFYHDEEQRKLAEHFKEQLDDSGAFADPIVTEITPTSEFYPAEKYHQDYYRANPTQGYCVYVIRPKVQKFQKAFAEKLRSDEQP